MCQCIQFNGTEEGHTPFVVKNKLLRFEYWVKVMQRRPVADAYLVRASVAIKMSVVPV